MLVQSHRFGEPDPTVPGGVSHALPELLQNLFRVPLVPGQHLRAGERQRGGKERVQSVEMERANFPMAAALALPSWLNATRQICRPC